jgi:hypothetical protein
MIRTWPIVGSPGGPGGRSEGLRLLINQRARIATTNRMYNETGHDWRMQEQTCTGIFTPFRGSVMDLRPEGHQIDRYLDEIGFGWRFPIPEPYVIVPVRGMPGCILQSIVSYQRVENNRDGSH